jgi:gamma-glutamyltranspeptidase/glutathione hydrolase
MSANFTTRPEILGTFGVVTSTHWLASAVGMSMLELGGNAFDAAVATGFVLQIVEPHLNGPGGEVPIILHRAGDETPRVLCGQGVAPAAATIARFGDLGLKMVPGTGLLPAVVPGAFDAWMLLLRDYGSMTLEQVLAPAIGYAERGFPVVPRVAEAVAPLAGFFKTEWPSSAEVWLPGGQPPKAGNIFATPGMALTYRRILDEATAAGADRIAQIEAARSAFYKGFVAEAIDRFYASFEAMDTSGRRHRGLLTGDDLADWQASYEDPIGYDYAGYRVYKTGAWGQGPVFLQQLALLKGFDLAAMDPLGPEFVHTLVECGKLAFADRDVFYGDPDFAEVPLETLLSDGYNDARRALVGEYSSENLRPGEIEDHERRLQVLLELSGCEVTAGADAGEPTFIDLPEVEGDTVHLDVIDRHGNMVSATPSGGWLSSSPVVPELGFGLTTRGQMFWLTDALPSGLAPGKRPRTTLTPTMASRDGAPCLAFGTPGGDQQDQWAMTVFLRHLHHGMNLQAAIDAPLFHSKHAVSSFYPRERYPGVLLMEGRFPESTQHALTDRGHKITVEDDWALGRVCAVGSGDGLLRAAATPRFMQGYAIGR